MVRGVERLGNLAGGLFGGIVGGVGGGGMALVIPAAMAIKNPAFIPLFLVLWVSMIYAIVRFAFSRVSAARERELRAAVDEVSSAARASISQRCRRSCAWPGRERSRSGGASEEEARPERRARRE